MTHDRAIVEPVGTQWFAAELLRRGFEVSVPIVDKGVDLIVFKEIGVRGIRALPLQLKVSTQRAFSLDRKYGGRGIPIVYIWRIFEEPTFYILTFEEALGVLGTRAETRSWERGGSYTVTNAGPALIKALEPYLERWTWLEERLAAQPTSGA